MAADTSGYETEKLSALLNYVTYLLSKPEHRSRFLSASPDEQADLLDEQGIPRSAAADVLQLLNLIRPNLEHLQGDESAAQSRLGDRSPHLTAAQVKDWQRESMAPFRRIRNAYRLSMAMSAVLFVVGVSLFVIATGRALFEGTASSDALLIAGLGTIDFIALVYTRPLKDIAANLAQTQRAGVLLMTYHAGLSLLEDQGAAMSNLERLTRLVVSGELERDAK